MPHESIGLRSMAEIVRAITLAHVGNKQEQVSDSVAFVLAHSFTARPATFVPIWCDLAGTV